MDKTTIDKFNHSILIKFFLIVFLIAQIVILLVISRLPDEIQRIPAHFIEDGRTYWQPIEIRTINPYQVYVEEISVSDFDIVTPGDYSYTLIDENGASKEILFSVFIYDKTIILYLAVSTVVPIILFIYSFRRGAYDLVD